MENKRGFIMRNGICIGQDVQRVFSTCPLGTVLSFAGQTAPRGFLLCDGASYLVKDYPDLYAVIGNTYGGDDVNFNVPDYRETVLVGVGENTTDTITSHDIYELGEFKDDQLQGHWHNLGNSNGTVTVALGASARGGSVMGANPASETRYTVENALDAITDGTNGEPRKGTTTHGKQKGVTYIIKAFHTNEGTDSGVSDDVIEYVDGEIDKKAAIDDTQAIETSVWSSQKTSDEITKKQDNLSARKVYVRRNSSTNKYVLLATIDMRIITNLGQPLRIKGVIGNMAANDTANIDLMVNARGGFAQRMLCGTITSKGSLSNNANIIITKSDDEKTAYVYLYCISPYGYIDVEMYLGSVHYSVPSTFDLVGTMQGTEYTNLLDNTYVVTEVGINDTTSSTISTYSSSKIDKKFAPRHFGTDNKTLWLKLQLGTMTTHEPITVTDQYGGQVKILGMYDLSTYKSVKVIRISYGDWSTHSGTDVSTTTSGDGNYKIRRLFYCPDDNNYYLEIRQYSYISVEGAPDATMVVNLPVETSAMTLIPESQFVSKTELAEKTANRQVKIFDNSGSSTEKWYKLCSAITGGIGCNIKLTASRADSTATVQYFSALFRDGRYRYTSACLTRERTVYESELVAEYSAYIVADANNDIWVHAPSYGKVIIEIDTRAITIDGTVGTPVKDYVYSSYESQSIKERLDRMNIKQFNQPGSNTSFKYVTITSTGSGLGGLELNVPYAGKYMFSTPKSAPVYFGSSSHKGYTLNGWAWSDDGKTLYLRVAGFAPFSISVLGSVPNDILVNNVATISDMTSTAPEGVTFVSTPVYSNAVINDSSTGDTTSTWSSSKIASELKTSSDRAITNISFNTDNFTQTESSSSWYYVKNGICYVSLDAMGVANGNNVLKTILPKPITMISVPIIPYNSTSKASGVLSLYPNQSCQSFSIAEGARYIVYFSYPIA